MDPNSAVYDEYVEYCNEFYQTENNGLVQKSISCLSQLANTANTASLSNNNSQSPRLFPERIASTRSHIRENFVSGIPVIRRVNSGDSSDDDLDKEFQSEGQKYHLQPKQQLSLPSQPQFNIFSFPAPHVTNNYSHNQHHVPSRVTSPMASQSFLAHANSRNSNMVALSNNVMQQQPTTVPYFVPTPKPISQVAPVPLNHNHMQQQQQQQVQIPPMGQQTPQDFIFATIYSVQFKTRKMRYCMGKLCKDNIVKGDFVIVGVHGLRGLDCGVVCDIIPPNDEKIRKAATEKDWAPSYNKNNILRKARHAEVLSLTQKTHDEQHVVEFARNVALNYHYKIQIVDAEYQFDRKKLEIYYLLPPNETDKPGNFEDFVYEIAVTLECHVVLETYKGGNK